MKDLNSSALIEDIRKIPLAALKIEGRMRSLAYLDETIRNYRCLLDGRPQNLQFSFSRKMSQGYLLENSYQKLTTPFENSQIGKLIGVVVSVKNRTIQTNLEEKVGPGDSIRLLSVHDSVSDNFLIIYAESSDQLVWQLKLDHAPSEKFKNKKTVIYLINKKFDHLMTPNRLHLAATHFKDFKLSLRATAQNNSIEIRITCDYPKLEIPAFEWKYQVNQWSDKDTDPSVIIRILKETSNPVWEIESVELSTPLPLYYKELKQMKRKMLKIAIPYFQCYRAQILNQRRVNPSENTPSLSPPPFRLVEINSPSQIKPDGELDQLFFLIDLDQRAQFSHEGIDRQHFFVRLPYFIPPIQSHKMAEIIDQLNQEKWPICLTHWAQIALTHDYPHPIIGHYSLYCTNHYTHRFYRKYQVDHIMVLPLSGSYQDPSMFPATSIKRELMYFRQRLPFEQVIYKGKTFPIKKHEDYGVLYESLTEPDSQT